MIEDNRCPGCMSAFLKSGTTSSSGIHCINCGHLTHWEKYHEVIHGYLEEKFAPKDEEEVIDLAI